MRRVTAKTGALSILVFAGIGIPGTVPDIFGRLGIRGGAGKCVEQS